MYYNRLRYPIIKKTSTQFNPYSYEMRVLLDLGPYLSFTYITMTFGDNPIMTIRPNKRYLEKENLPKEQLIAFFDAVRINFGHKAPEDPTNIAEEEENKANEKDKKDNENQSKSKEEDGWTLQFQTCVCNYSTLTHSLVQITEFMEYEKGEIIHNAGDGFIIWKKNEKSINHWFTPVNFKNKQAYRRLYDSSAYLKQVKLTLSENYGNNKLNIVDESKYVKVYNYRYDNNNSGKMIVDGLEDYFVNKEFTGILPFLYTNKMLYIKSKGYL